jgi:hypothetical protein
LPEDCIPATFESDFMRLPLAPGEGLVLKEPHYAAYNKKNPDKSMAMTEEEYAKIAEFRGSVVMPVVTSQYPIFESWSAEEV